jgi:anthranilate synthase component II
LAAHPAYVIVAANMKAFLIDHDDSFTQNLKHWLKPIFEDVIVINHSNLKKLEQPFDVLILSPGPKSPQDYPHSLALLKKISPEKPVFGVCLGLQMMAISCGLQVSTYSPPLHGKTSRLKSLSPDLKNFENLAVARYHSIKVENSESDFEILATASNDNQPMWFKHKSKKWMAVQFHPESFLTEDPTKHLQYLKSWLQS